MKGPGQVKVTEIAALVVQEGHERYGRLAKLLWHDWRESGMMGLEFADGKTHNFPDDNGSVRTFYRFQNSLGNTYDNDGVGPLQLMHSYVKAGGTEDSFRQEYAQLFQESFPLQKEPTVLPWTSIRETEYKPQKWEKLQ